jgi:hypothetical protein
MDPISALLPSANPDFIYTTEQREKVIEGLLRGECHLFYGPGGTGKTYELMSIVATLKQRYVMVQPTALANDMASRIDGKGIFNLFGLYLEDVNGVKTPRCKLDSLCAAVRRSSSTRHLDPLWDGNMPTEKDKKDAEYMGKYVLRNRNISLMSDLDIISLINIRTAKFKQLACAEVLQFIRSVRVFCIEELFMIGDKLFELMDGLMRKYRNYDVPFGGCGLLLSGDALQTVPINSSFLFTSRSWAQLKPIPHLFATYRRFDESDVDFLGVLSRARRGEITDSDDALLRSRMRSVVKSTSSYALCRTREEAARMNLSKFSEIKSKRFVISARDTLYRYENNEQEEVFNILPERLHDEAKRVLGDIARETELLGEVRAAEGAKVIITHNDRDTKIYNGYTGVITEVVYTSYNAEQAKQLGKSGSITSIKIKFDRTFVHSIHEFETPSVGDELILEDRVCKVLKIEGDIVHTHDTVEIRRITRRVIKRGYAVDRIQFPFDLCWGRTIHKAQGSTIEDGALVLSGRMSPGQAYVGCSRFRKLIDIVIEDNYDRSVFKAHYMALDFDTQIQENGIWLPTDVLATTEEPEEKQYEEKTEDVDEELLAFLRG